MKKTVILLHGLMASSLTTKYLEKQLVLAGYQVKNFSYASNRYSMQTLIYLHNLVQTIRDGEIYFIGHSMGGLVARNYLQHDLSKPNAQIKALITVATPHNGSLCAQKVLRSKLGRFFGTAGSSGLTENIGKWQSDILLGCIAGLSTSKLSRNFFIMFNGKTEPSDGTVFVEEAILSNCTDHIVIKGSHTGLLFKKLVAQQCIFFLENGEFINIESRA